MKRWPRVLDESTYISVLKQLVLVACYILHTGDVTTSFVAFLAIDDLPDGTAETIEHALIGITSK